jgi:hypothetical protein
VKEIAERLVAAGLSAAQADRKARLFDLAEQRLALLTRRACKSAPRWFVPGRIEVLGKHTEEREFVEMIRNPRSRGK